MPHLVHMLVAGVALLIFAATTACMVSGCLGCFAIPCLSQVVQEGVIPGMGLLRCLGQACTCRQLASIHVLALAHACTGVCAACP
jgi:hypothetical protein